MMKWLLSGLVTVFMALGIWCFLISRAAQKVVSVVDGPPLLQQQIDFSKPFTNEFTFHQTVEPIYGTMYLTLKADPWPKEWTTSNIASEELTEARGIVRVYQANNILINERPLDWAYVRYSFAISKAISESETTPLQGFFGRLPPGRYRFVISTQVGIPKLEGSKQELILRCDLIHERGIASLFRALAIIFGFGALITGTALVFRIRRGIQTKD